MFGIRKKLSVTNEKSSCSICIFSAMNEEFDLVCKGKKVVEPDHKCRKFKLDITKAANERSHATKKLFDQDAFTL